MSTLAEHYKRLRAPVYSPYNARRLCYQTGAKSALTQARYALEADATVLTSDAYH